MHWLRSSELRRYTAIGLMLSLWPMLWLPVLRTSQYNGAERHVEWLKDQLGDETSEAVDSAIDKALAQNAHNVHLFLEAFVEAYFQEKGAIDRQNGADAVLLALFQRHWLMLIGEAVAPSLSFKSLQSRTSPSKDRSGSTLFAVVRSQLATLLGREEGTHRGTLLTRHLLQYISHSVFPRGP